MNWGDLGKKVGQTGAQLLGRVVGGPVGSQLGGILAGAFGADPDDPDDIARKIENDPEAHLKLVELENRHEEKLQEFELKRMEVAVEETRIHQADRGDARAREIAIMQKTGKRDWAIYVLAGVNVVGFFVMGITLLAFEIPEDNRMNIGILIGGLVSGYSTVLAYFFGSSKSSAQKTELMAQQGQAGRAAVG